MASEEEVKQFRKFFQHSRQDGDRSGNHFSSVGLQVLNIENGWASMRFESADHLAGNPINGAVAAGPVIALLDTCCAMAAATCGDKIRLSPTLDLRVDFLGPAKPNLTVYAEAKAYRDSRYVIFTEGMAYQDDKDKPIARCSINFTPIEHRILKDRADAKNSERG